MAFEPSLLPEPVHISTSLGDQETEGPRGMCSQSSMALTAPKFRSWLLGLCHSIPALGSELRSTPRQAHLPLHSCFLQEAFLYASHGDPSSSELQKT